MWETLLALGQIPGTNIQITFTELLIVVELILLAYLFRNKIGKLLHFRQTLHLIHLYLLTKKGQQLKLPV